MNMSLFMRYLLGIFHYFIQLLINSLNLKFFDWVIDCFLDMSLVRVKHFWKVRNRSGDSYHYTVQESNTCLSYTCLSYTCLPDFKSTTGLAFIKKQPPEVLCKKGVLKIFAKFTGSTCARVSFLIKLQAWGLQLY